MTVKIRCSSVESAIIIDMQMHERNDNEYLQCLNKYEKGRKTA